MVAAPPREPYVPPIAAATPASDRVCLLVLLALVAASWAIVWLAVTRPLMAVGLWLGLVAALAFIALYRSGDVMPPEQEGSVTDKPKARQ